MAIALTGLTPPRGAPGWKREKRHKKGTKSSGFRLPTRCRNFDEASAAVAVRKQRQGSQDHRPTGHFVSERWLPKPSHDGPSSRIYDTQ